MNESDHVVVMSCGIGSSSLSMSSVVVTVVGSSSFVSVSLTGVLERIGIL